MIKFVVSKPIKKISRQSYHGVVDGRVAKATRRRIPMKTIWIVFGIFVLIYGSILLLKNTLFNQEYVIAKIQYDTGDIQKYDDPYMYKLISAYIKQENYNILRMNKGSILAGVQTKYPFIKDITITLASANAVKVNIVFSEPELIIKNQSVRFGVLNGTIFPLYSGNTLGKSTKILDLPEYLSGQNFMTGFFYRQAASGLIQQIELIYQGFPTMHHIEYLPGGERSIVYLDGRKIYINNLSDVTQQIRNFELLKKYYPDFASLKEIDLGSLESDKIIVKK